MFPFFSAFFKFFFFFNKNPLYVHYNLPVMTDPPFFCERQKDLMITKHMLQDAGRTDVFTGVEQPAACAAADGRRGPGLHLYFSLPLSLLV